MMVVEQIKELISLASEVKALRDDFRHLAGDIKDLRERVIRIEINGEVTLAKAEKAAASAVCQSLSIVFERLDKAMGTIQDVAKNSNKISPGSGVGFNSQT